MRKCGICGCTGHDKRKHTSEEILVHNLVKSVITNALKTNKKISKKTKNIIIIKSKSKDSLDNENNFILIFNSDENYKIYIFKLLNKNLIDYEIWIAIKPIKKEGITLKHTEEWNKFKEGTGEKYPTSKTDVILLNKVTGEKIGISIKSGSGRLTSADCYETCALFQTSLNHNGYFYG